MIYPTVLSAIHARGDHVDRTCSCCLSQPSLRTRCVQCSCAWQVGASRQSTWAPCGGCPRTRRSRGLAPVRNMSLGTANQQCNMHACLAPGLRDEAEELTSGHQCAYGLPNSSYTRMHPAPHHSLARTFLRSRSRWVCAHCASAHPGGILHAGYNWVSYIVGLSTFPVVGLINCICACALYRLAVPYLGVALPAGCSASPEAEVKRAKDAAAKAGAAVAKQETPVPAWQPVPASDGIGSSERRGSRLVACFRGSSELLTPPGQAQALSNAAAAQLRAWGPTSHDIDHVSAVGPSVSRDAGTAGAVAAGANSNGAAPGSGPDSNGAQPHSFWRGLRVSEPVRLLSKLLPGKRASNGADAAHSNGSSNGSAAAAGHAANGTGAANTPAAPVAGSNSAAQPAEAPRRKRTYPRAFRRAWRAAKHVRVILGWRLRCMAVYALCSHCLQSA